MENFLPELKAKLAAEGLPMLEDDLLKIYRLVSAHVKGFNYSNDLAKALVPVVMIAVDKLVEEQIEKIDKSDNPA